MCDFKNKNPETNGQIYTDCQFDMDDDNGAAATICTVYGSYFFISSYT